VFGDHKFGGNAQAITGKRWLHHSSLLWDFQPQRMGLLAQPRKQPQYRQVLCAVLCCAVLCCAVLC
jgi:lipoate-protein ligase A